jgi:polysaccharide pyruvyl transferase WcaK-like protein
MRLHFVIFAALAGVPVLALPYASKVIGFLEHVGLPTPQLIQRQHAGALLAAIDRIWDLRDEHRRVVAARMPGMQAESRMTAPLIAGLLAHKASDAAARPA